MIFGKITGISAMVFIIVCFLNVILISMQIKSKKIKDSLYVYLSGELDEYSSHECRALMDKLFDDAEDVKKVILEMGNLQFMDSTGIGVLIGRYKKLKSKNIGLYLQNPPLHIEKIIELSGLYSIMPKL